MKDKKMFFQSFIEVDIWNRAKWKGAMYLLIPDKYPYLGLIFENEKEGNEIFDGWLKRLGQEDKYDELYLSIVEGEIQGQESGYSVLISSDPQATKRRAKEEGKDLDFNYVALVSRIHRMNPPPNSENLLRFKEKYLVQRKYYLMPVYWDNEANKPKMPFDFSRAILKSNVGFKNVRDIGKNDIEQAVLGKSIS